MSDNKERAGVELYLDVAKYIRDVDAAIGKAGEFEAAWKAAMGSIGSADVSLTVNTAELDTVTRQIADLDAEAVTLPFDVVDNELQDAVSIVNDLDAESVTLPFDVADDELDTAQNKVNDLDGEVAEVKVEADPTDANTDLSGIQEQLDQLKSLAIIDLVMNVSGPALGVLQQALDLVTSTDEAVRTLAARTGQEIPNAANIIDELYTAGWGESKQQIAETLALTSQMGVANDQLWGATASAFDAAAVTGEDVNAVMRTMVQLVNTGLVPDFQSASDLIVTGFQSGANRGGDFLDSLNEFSSKFAAIGATGPQALALINAGLDNGFESAGKVADLLNEVQIRVTDINDQGAQDALKELGLTAPADGQAIGVEFLDQIIAGIQAAAPEKQETLTRALFGSIAEDKGLAAVLGLNDTDPVNATFDTINGRAEESATLIKDTLNGAVTEFFRTVEVEAQNFLSSDQINLDQKISDIKNGITSTLDALKGGEGLADAIEIGFNIPGFADSVGRFEASIGEFAIGVLELIAGVQDFLGKDSSGTRGQIAQLAGNQLAFNLKVANPDEIQGEIDRAVARGVSEENITAAIGTATTELISGGEIAQAQQLLESLSEVRYVAKAGLSDIERTAAEIALRQVEAGTLTNEALQSAVDRGLLVPIGVDPSQFQDEIDVATKAAQAQFDAAVQSGDFSLAKSIAEDLGNSGELFNQAFNDAIASGDFDLAESIANQSGEINPAAVIVVDAFREQAKAARRAAFEELGGFEDAGAEGGAAGKRDFVTTTSAPIDPAALDQMKAGKDLADLLGQTTTAVSQSVVSDSDAMAAAFEDADARIASAATGNTMTASFEAVRDVAMQTMPEMSAVFVTATNMMIAKEIEFTNQTNILKGAILGLLGQTGQGILNLATNLANISANASAAAGATSALFAAQGAGAGGGNTVTVNNNYNVNSVATGVATGQAVATSLRSQ